MTLTVYNTLTRTKERFEPLEPGRVRMYVCGPTVYDHAHIGHAKLYVSMDVIVRYLRHKGFEVTYVQNITDVGHILDSGEDRILKGARRERIEPMEVVERYMRSYLDDMDALGNVRPNIMPRAAAHVPEQIAATQRLIEKGHAYEVNGSVYFDVSSWPEYGKLSGRRIAEQETGARVATAVRQEKRNPEDFALWKLAEPDHILRWPSPWGDGYPGWHIECTAMSTKYLGETYDIHGGGLENMFPHNECEVAQSEALTGKPYANYWLLAGSLSLDGVKMSKSLGNVVTIKDALARYPAGVLRFFILSSLYRSPIDYSDDALEGARRGWERLVGPYNEVCQRLAAADLPASDDFDPDDLLQDARARFEAAMDDDFNSPVALAVLREFSRNVNSMLNRAAPPARATLEKVAALYRELAGDVLGLLTATTADRASAEREAGLIQLLVDMREEARQRRDFATADAIRDRVQALGVLLEDGKDGTKWRLAQPQ
ncbi:MAG: cysteine--tRNA ligase [Anaerolineales bacterium]